jgi:hypothetical protein
MKSVDDVKTARGKVVAALAHPKLEPRTRLMAMGMSVALQWVAEKGGDSLQQLIDGKSMREDNDAS